MDSIQTIYSVEVSGACNLEATCKWCPMHTRPRYRKRGLMDDRTVDRAYELVNKLGVPDVLALHVFGEPLLHPKFDEIALRFSRIVDVTMSTNGVLLDEKWADRLAKVPWAWVSVSPWNPEAKARAIRLLNNRNVCTREPSGVTHNWAGQASEGPTKKLIPLCPFLRRKTAVIRWDGTWATCCISDREDHALGSIFDETIPSVRPYDICETCHHNQ